MQTVFITGSNGLLGQKLLSLFAPRNDLNVIALSRGENHSVLPTEHYCYESVELTDFQRLTELFEQYEPNVVIHTAAMTQVDPCESQKELCWQVNVTMVERIAYLCQLYQSRLLYLSTDFVFDGLKNPYQENSLPSPLSHYGKSKWAAEKRIQESLVEAAIIRTVLVYGVNPKMSRSNFVLWVKKSLTQNQEISIVSDQIRTPTLVEDLAKGILNIFLRKKQGIFHLSGAESVSILEFAYRIADFWNLPKNLIKPVKGAQLKQLGRRPLNTSFLLTKAYTELDFKPHTLEEGFQIINQKLSPS